MPIQNQSSLLLDIFVKPQTAQTNEDDEHNGEAQNVPPKSQCIETEDIENRGGWNIDRDAVLPEMLACDVAGRELLTLTSFRLKPRSSLTIRASRVAWNQDVLKSHSTYTGTERLLINRPAKRRLLKR